MDNRTAICYINHLGGTRSHVLLHTACQLWQWCLQRGIESDLTADQESCTLQSSAEWVLNTTALNKITQVLNWAMFSDYTTNTRGTSVGDPTHLHGRCIPDDREKQARIIMYFTHLLSWANKSTSAKGTGAQPTIPVLHSTP